MSGQRRVIQRQEPAVFPKHLYPSNDFSLPPFEHPYDAPAATLTVLLPCFQAYQDTVALHHTLHGTAWQVDIVLLPVIQHHKTVPLRMPPDHPGQGIQTLRQGVACAMHEEQLPSGRHSADDLAERWPLLGRHRKVLD